MVSQIVVYVSDAMALGTVLIGLQLFCVYVVPRKHRWAGPVSASSSYQCQSIVYVFWTACISGQIVVCFLDVPAFCWLVAMASSSDLAVPVMPLFLNMRKAELMEQAQLLGVPVLRPGCVPAEFLSKTKATLRAGCVPAAPRLRPGCVPVPGGCIPAASRFLHSYVPAASRFPAASRLCSGFSCAASRLCPGCLPDEFPSKGGWGRGMND